MRGFLVTSTVSAAALSLPFLATSPGVAPANASSGTTSFTGAPNTVPGSTQSVPLVRLGGSDRARTNGPAEQGVPQREVKPFSLIGIVWDDAGAELRGRAQVRTRAVGSRAWSGWQDVQTHDDDRPDLDSREARNGRLRGSTAPLWVGASDAIQLRVRPDAATERTPEGRALPAGMRLELVDPGAAPAPQSRRVPVVPPGTDEERASSAANAPLAPLGATEIPAAGRKAARSDVAATGTGRGRMPSDEPEGDTENDDSGDSGDWNDSDESGDSRVSGDPDDGYDQDGPSDSGENTAPDGRYTASRPRIVTRAGWGADESLRERAFAYTKTVKAAFVHHTASGNNYSCSESASVIRGIYRYHVVSSGWRDIGYNFLVDKCGTIYEGRAGGVAKPVMGAHTLGFNTNSMGIAVLGSFASSTPPKAAVNALSSLTAWKLGLYGVNPRGTATLVSGGGNLFKKGTSVKLKAISGHRDGYATECPGDRLYSKLGTTRSAAARLQGR
ncbi:N-acetylmuramoyl-L-alanine amidase [Streptomyces sp. NPDC020379]|uniref:N-acetylmuramoyl-L-alanine amidase n=1 Tax=Streptomyces sp. NPDC020379 TaxID=3365071 RepID=UPI00379E51BA